MLTNLPIVYDLCIGYKICLLNIYPNFKLREDLLPALPQVRPAARVPRRPGTATTGCARPPRRRAGTVSMRRRSIRLVRTDLMASRSFCSGQQLPRRTGGWTARPAPPRPPLQLWRLLLLLPRPHLQLLQLHLLLVRCLT